MKILMLGWELPPHNSGGLGVASYGLAQALSKNGHEIDFVVPYADKHDISFMKVTNVMPYSASELQFMGGAYDSGDFYKYQSRIDFDHSIKEPMSLVHQQIQYSKFISQYAADNEFDLIHAHEWLTFEAGSIARQISGKPLIAHVHATEFDRSGEFHGNPAVHDIEEHGLLMADRIVAVSRHTKNVITNNYHIPADKIEVIHNGINHDDYVTYEGESVYKYLDQMKQRDYKVVVSIGRLTAQKGLTYLLRAFADVVNIEPKSLLLVVGSGELYQELIELSAELGIAKNVLFTGFQRGRNLREAYSVGDAFVMPSVSEPFGIAPLEAASYGTPVIISKTSGVGEVLRSSFRVDYWDTLAMADRIINLLRHESLRSEMVTNARQEFEGMTWQKVAENCRHMYKNLVQATSGAEAEA